MGIAEEKLMLGRFEALDKAPYFAPVIYGLIYVPDPSIPTMEVDAELICSYNPEFVEKLTVPEVAGVLAHEAIHVISEHVSRFSFVTDPKDVQRAQLAMDFPINPSLRDAGWVLPGCGQFPRDYDLPEGKTAEEYFALLEGKVSEHATGVICAGGCGSIAGGKGKAKAKTIKGRLPGEIERIVEQAARDIAEHAASGRGNVPGFLKEFAKNALLPAQIPWEVELATFLRHCTGKIVSGGMDFSMRRPSKRSYSRDLLRPGLVQHLPELTIILDSSGSMGTKQLSDGVREACGVMRALGLHEAWYITADTEAASIKRATLSEIPNIPIVGRGGTDFVRPIEQALKLFPRPNILIYFTDGDGEAPPTPPPGVEVIWCIVKSPYYNTKKKPAPWGHTVFLRE